MRRALLPVFFGLLGCSNGGGTPDAGTVTDAAVEAGPTLAITFTNDIPTPVVPGAAMVLTVVIQNPDGTTSPLPTGANVTWTSPPTLVAFDPNDAGGAALPSLSPAPLAFFIENPFRPDRSDYAGVMFVCQQGNTDTPNITVTAQVDGLGTVTAYVPVRAPLVGDPDAGAAEYVANKCDQCHGDTGAGSPMNDAGTYTMQGGTYPYPAPAINAGDGGAVNDPTWSAALYGLAGQGSVDNNGVALRKPMPDLLGPTTAQTYADIYAFMQTQTQ
jgi:hypothetical protein